MTSKEEMIMEFIKDYLTSIGIIIVLGVWLGVVWSIAELVKNAILKKMK